MGNLDPKINNDIQVKPQKEVIFSHEERMLKYRFGNNIDIGNNKCFVIKVLQDNMNLFEGW